MTGSVGLTGSAGFTAATALTASAGLAGAERDQFGVEVPGAEDLVRGQLAVAHAIEVVGGQSEIREQTAAVT